MKLKKSVSALAVVSAVALTGIIVGCSKPVGDPEAFMKIGKKTYTVGEYKTFSTMQYNHPDLRREGFFPGKRYATSLFTETEVLYDEAKQYESQVVGTNEWKWKEIFILGQYFQRDVLKFRMGATKEELDAYYKKHKAAITFDLGGDSTITSQSLPVVQRLFAEKYPVDEEFANQFKGMNEKVLADKWYEYQSKRPIIFFRNEYYKEFYGKPYPDNYNEVFGAGKLITEEDYRTVLTWLPENSQPREDDLAKKKEIIGYMVSWKLFAEKAKQTGHNKQAYFKLYSKFFKRYEVVRHYLNNILTDRLGSDISSIDNDMLTFAYFDKKGKMKDKIDSTQYNDIAMVTAEQKTNNALMEYIAKKRNEVGVEMIHEDYTDEMAKKSDRIFFEADSLFNSGERDKSKKLYRDLIRYYGYSKEGVEAYRALAMIFSDEGAYQNAINSYRKYLLLSEPNDDWCKVFFMIGYTYGEHLNKLDLAADNYRYVLKNRPDCDLIDDAEFMYLHLGEPMSDVEELQAENARQGRNLLK